MNKLKLKSIFKTTVFGLLIAFVILAILFSLFSIVVLYSNISPTIISQVSTILGAISLFLAAFITTRTIKKNGLLIGFIFGVATSILIFLITFFATGVIFSVGILIKTLTIIICSCLGGVLGVNFRN